MSLDDGDRRGGLLRRHGRRCRSRGDDVHLVFHGAQLAKLAARYRLPSIHSFRQNVETGGLMSYGPDTVAVWRRAALFVDKILKGRLPTCRSSNPPNSSWSSTSRPPRLLA